MCECVNIWHTICTYIFTHIFVFFSDCRYEIVSWTWTFSNKFNWYFSFWHRADSSYFSSISSWRGMTKLRLVHFLTRQGFLWVLTSMPIPGSQSFLPHSGTKFSPPRIPEITSLFLILSVFDHDMVSSYAFSTWSFQLHGDNSQISPSANRKDES